MSILGKVFGNRAVLKPTREVEVCYIETFLKSEVGVKTLKMILTDLGFFSGQMESDEDVFEMNAAFNILRKCGILRADNVDAVMQSLREAGISAHQRRIENGKEERA